MAPPELKGLITMVITLSPLIISTFLILASFLKRNLQGIVYLGGLLLAQIFGYLIRPLFGNDGIRPDIVRLKNGENFILKHRACNLIEDPWLSQYSCPSFHAVFHSFTFIYVFYGQFLQTKIKDYPFFIFYIIIFAADFFFRVTNNCVYIRHYIIGMVFGGTLGLAYYYIVNSINPKLTFESSLIDRERCVMTKANLVKCKNKIGIIDGEGKFIEFVKNPENLSNTVMQEALFNAALEGSAKKEDGSIAYKGDGEATQV